MSIFFQGEHLASHSVSLGTTALRNMVATDLDPQTPMAEALQKSDQLLKERAAKLIADIRATIQDEEDVFCVGVGTAITRATGMKDNESRHDQTLTISQIENKINDLTAQLTRKFKTVGDVAAWEKTPTDDATDDALTMRLGLPMHLQLMKQLNMEQIHVCGTSLWYGVYFQHLLEN